MATRNGRGRRPLVEPRSQVDLEACECVDVGHDWPRGEITRKVKGRLSGLPMRQQVCKRCDTVRYQTLTWNGLLAGGSVYDYSEDYINAARQLDPDMHERKRAYREILIHRSFTPDEIPARAREAS